MPDRAEPAPQPSHHTTTVAPRHYTPTPWPSTGSLPVRSPVPRLQGPLPPNIPRQWTGPVLDSFPSRWDDQPPAGLAAPLPLPETRSIRNAFLGITGLLVVFVTLGSLANSTGFAPWSGPGTTVEAWRDGGGLDRLNALSTDFNAVEDAAAAHDIDGMNSACIVLQADTESAQEYSPIPDAEAEAHWAAALEHLAEGSSTCVTALQFDSAALLLQASDEMDAVPPAWSQVINRLTELSR